MSCAAHIYREGRRILSLRGWCIPCDGRGNITKCCKGSRKRLHLGVAVAGWQYTIIRLSSKSIGRREKIVVFDPMGYPGKLNIILQWWRFLYTFVSAVFFLPKNTYYFTYTRFTFDLFSLIINHINIYIFKKHIF